MKTIQLLPIFLVLFLANLNAQWVSENGPNGGVDVFAVNASEQDLWLWDNQGIVKLDINQINWTTPVLYNPNWEDSPGSRIYLWGDTVFAVRPWGPVIRSFNAGQSWDTITTVPSTASSEFAKMETKGDTIFLLNGFVHLYQTTDFGDHWDWISQQIKPQINGSVRDILVHGSTVYITNWKSIYRSDDNLQSWQLTGDSLPFGQNTAVIRLFATDHYLYAWVNESQLFLSENHGESWYPAVLPSANFIIGSSDKVQFAEIGNNLIALFEWNGILKSSDAGQNWQFFQEGLPYPVHVSEFTISDSSFRLGTLEFGLFKRPISDLSTISTTQPRLSQNKLEISLNPSQGIFNLKIPVEISGTANLQVFNLQGQQMLHRTESAEHLSTIDLSQCPKGVYWVSLTTAQGVFGGTVLLQ